MTGTFDFRAEEFHLKNGYAVIGEILISKKDINKFIFQKN